MDRTRLFARLIVMLFLLVVTGSSVSCSSAGISSENGAVDVEPILRLEKPRYVLGESIRFWVGESTKGSTGIPESLRTPCRLSITTPDGARSVESISWPADGSSDDGWLGGWGLGDRKIEPGEYTLVLDCAGNKTPPVKLIVERNEVFSQINAAFRFEREGAVTKATKVPVVLTVQNDSQSVVRFPKRGALMEGVSIKVVRKEPAFSSEFFYPWQKLSHLSTGVASFTYTWEAASDVPSVVLQPGQHFEQRLLLGEAYSFDGDGDYKITFSTVLSVLVGEQGGQFTELCPIRIPVTKSAMFDLSNPQ
jgi:hypothetical protein